jgi:hypothetical protein
MCSRGKNRFRDTWGEEKNLDRALLTPEGITQSL